MVPTSMVTPWLIVPGVRIVTGVGGVGGREYSPPASYFPRFPRSLSGIFENKSTSWKDAT